MNECHQSLHNKLDKMADNVDGILIWFVPAAVLGLGFSIKSRWRSALLVYTESQGAFSGVT